MRKENNDGIMGTYNTVHYVLGMDGYGAVPYEGGERAGEVFGFYLSLSLSLSLFCLVGRKQGYNDKTFSRP